MLNVAMAQGNIENKIFAFPVRIYYEDTDAGGIVYYANYLKFAERARSEFLRFLKIDQQKLLKEKQVGFVVRSCNIEYLSSAYLNDDLLVTCQVREMGGASAVIYQEVLRDNEILAKIAVKVVFMNVATHRPTRIDTEISEKFVQLLD